MDGWMDGLNGIFSTCERHFMALLEEIFSISFRKNGLGVLKLKHRDGPTNFSTIVQHSKAKSIAEPVTPRSHPDPEPIRLTSRIARHLPIVSYHPAGISYTSRLASRDDHQPPSQPSSQLDRKTLGGGGGGISVIRCLSDQ
jgi:hypothetical protein